MPPVRPSARGDRHHPVAAAALVNQKWASLLGRPPMLPSYIVALQLLRAVAGSEPAERSSVGGHGEAAGNECSNLHASCWRWAAAGDCDRLRSFMHVDCAAACGRCGVQPSEDPCGAVTDLAPGAVAESFRKAAALAHLKPTVLSEDPFIVVFDAFATPEEAAELASLAEGLGFEPSGSSCGYRPGGCNSSSMSCVPVHGGACWSHAAMRALEARMLEVAGLPAAHCEPLRFFRYNEGERFGRHHDAAGAPVPRRTPGGPRVWTLYVFLQAAASGGEFRFPGLGHSVAAAPGRAVLWPHLRDDDLATPDERTEHEGSEVREGTKVGVNLHAHRSDLRARVLGGCAAAGRGAAAGASHTFGYESSAGATPLHDLVGWQGASAARSVPRLVEAGEDVDAADEQGTTPLMIAAGQGGAEVVTALLEAGAEVGAADAQGATALHYAAWKGMEAAVRLLLARGAAVGAAGGKGRSTPLHVAAKHGQRGAMRALIEAGAALDAPTTHGSTPLALAAKAGQVRPRSTSLDLARPRLISRALPWAGAGGATIARRRRGARRGGRRGERSVPPRGGGGARGGPRRAGGRGRGGERAQRARQHAPSPGRRPGGRRGGGGAARGGRGSGRHRRPGRRHHSWLKEPPDLARASGLSSPGSAAPKVAARGLPALAPQAPRSTAPRGRATRARCARSARRAPTSRARRAAAPPRCTSPPPGGTPARRARCSRRARRRAPRTATAARRARSLARRATARWGRGPPAGGSSAADFLPSPGCRWSGCWLRQSGRSGAPAPIARGGDGAPTGC